jgi:hypothetical protein
MLPVTSMQKQMSTAYRSPLVAIASWPGGLASASAPLAGAGASAVSLPGAVASAGVAISGSDAHGAAVGSQKPSMANSS